MNQDFARAMQRFIEHIRQRHPTSCTAIHYQSDLEQFRRVVDKAPRQVSRADVSHFVTGQLTQGLSAATVNRRLATLSSLPSTSSGRRIDGANPDVRADYQTAMKCLSACDAQAGLSEAESRDSRAIPVAESMASSPSEGELQPSAGVAVAPALRQAQDAALTAREIEGKASELPGWLRSPIVDFLLGEQVRWPCGIELTIGINHP